MFKSKAKKRMAAKMSEKPKAKSKTKDDERPHVDPVPPGAQDVAAEPAVPMPDSLGNSPPQPPAHTPPEHFKP